MSQTLLSERTFDTDLANWFDPVSAPFFQQAYWKQSPLYIKGSPTRLAKLREIFLGLDLNALLHSAGRANENCIRAWFLNNGKTDTRLTAQPAQALILFDANFTLYFEPKTPAVLDFVRELMLKSGNSVEAAMVSIFASKKAHFTATHVDNNENFTIQLQGRKEWTVGHDEAVADQKFILAPGDLLYCPGPWRHSVLALEDSISLNLNFIKKRES